MPVTQEYYPPLKLAVGDLVVINPKANWHRPGIWIVEDIGHFNEQLNQWIYIVSCTLDRRFCYTENNLEPLYSV